jgi:hypothetical protein
VCGFMQQRVGAGTHLGYHRSLSDAPSAITHWRIGCQILSLLYRNEQHTISASERENDNHNNDNVPGRVHGEITGGSPRSILAAVFTGISGQRKK